MAETIDPLPSDLETLTLQQKNILPSDLHYSDLIVIGGPIGVGKTKLTHEVTALSEDIISLRSAQTEGQSSRFYIHDCDVAYESHQSSDDSVIDIDTIAIDSIHHLQRVFRSARIVYPLMEAHDYEERLQWSLSAEDSRHLLLKSAETLDFARFNLRDTESWLSFVETDNKEGTLQRVASTVINLAYQNTAPILTSERQLELLDDMSGVVQRTLKSL